MVWIERVVLFLPLPWAPYTRILTFKDNPHHYSFTRDVPLL